MKNEDILDISMDSKTTLCYMQEDLPDNVVNDLMNMDLEQDWLDEQAQQTSTCDKSAMCPRVLNQDCTGSIEQLDLLDGQQDDEPMSPLLLGLDWNQVCHEVSLLPPALLSKNCTLCPLFPVCAREVLVNLSLIR